MRIDEHNYVDEAEKVIQGLKNQKDGRGRAVVLTTSKLRNLLSMTTDIYNDVQGGTEETLGEDICSRIEYLRVRFLYEAGREPAVRALVERAGLLELLKGIKGERKAFLLFNRYIEALVAFHKFENGQD